MLKNEPKLAIVAVHTEENEPPKVQESPEKIIFKPVETFSRKTNGNSRLRLTRPYGHSLISNFD